MEYWLFSWVYCIQRKSIGIPFRCTVKVANRSRPSPVTCLVVTEARGAGIILNFILGQKRLQMWILRWAFAISPFLQLVGSETVTPSLTVSTATPMGSSISLTWCAGMGIRWGVCQHFSFAFLILTLYIRLFCCWSSLSSVLRLWHWVPLGMGAAEVHWKPGQFTVLNKHYISLHLLTYFFHAFWHFPGNRSFEWGRGSTPIAFSPFQSTRYQTFYL